MMVLSRLNCLLPLETYLWTIYHPLYRHMAQISGQLLCALDQRHSRHSWSHQLRCHARYHINTGVVVEELGRRIPIYFEVRPFHKFSYAILTALDVPIRFKRLPLSLLVVTAAIPSSLAGQVNKNRGGYQ